MVQKSANTTPRTPQQAPRVPCPGCGSHMEEDYVDPKGNSRKRLLCGFHNNRTGEGRGCEDLYSKYVRTALERVAVEDDAPLPMDREHWVATQINIPLFAKESVEATSAHNAFDETHVIAKLRKARYWDEERHKPNCPEGFTLQKILWEGDAQKQSFWRMRCAQGRLTAATAFLDAHPKLRELSPTDLPEEKPEPPAEEHEAPTDAPTDGTAPEASENSAPTDESGVVEPTAMAPESVDDDSAMPAAAESPAAPAGEPATSGSKRRIKTAAASEV